MSLNRLLVIAVILCLLGFSSGMAKAAGSRIVSGGFMGLSLPAPTLAVITPVTVQWSSSFSDRPKFAGSLGFRLTPQWRIEGELSYGASGVKGVGESVSRTALMNVYYDFETKSKWKPFLSFGAGVVTHDIYHGGITGLNVADDSETGMAWQTGGGLNYQLNDDLSLSGGYRFVGSASPEDKGYKFDDGGHELRFGVNYKLPVQRNRDVPD